MLAPLRARYRHAFEVSGSGWAGSWPVPLPLLGLDQVWVDPRIVPTHSALRWSASDHAALHVDLAVRRPAVSGD